jgi:hypothetical protein
MKTFLALLAALLLFGAGVLLAPRLQPWLAHLGHEAPAAAPAATERQPVKYRHPMNPTIFSDTPAKDDMGMDYIPVYADGDDGASAGPGFTIAPEVVNNLGVRTAAVERGDLTRRIETVGYVDYDERALSHVHLRASGWVENLKVRTLGARVRRGDLLMEVYAPDLVSAQQEYLQSLRGDIALLRVSARDRLVALGVPESQIERLEKRTAGRAIDRRPRPPGWNHFGAQPPRGHVRHPGNGIDDPGRSRHRLGASRGVRAAGRLAGGGAKGRGAVAARARRSLGRNGGVYLPRRRSQDPRPTRPAALSQSRRATQVQHVRRCRDSCHAARQRPQHSP